MGEHGLGVQDGGQGEGVTGYLRFLEAGRHHRIIGHYCRSSGVLLMTPSPDWQCLAPGLGPHPSHHVLATPIECELTAGIVCTTPWVLFSLKCLGARSLASLGLASFVNKYEYEVYLQV